MLIVFWITLIFSAPSLTQTLLTPTQAIIAPFFNGWFAHILFIYLVLFTSFLFSLNNI